MTENNNTIEKTNNNIMDSNNIEIKANNNIMDSNNIETKANNNIMDSNNIEIEPKKIYGLYVNDNFDGQCTYIHAFSYDMKILENFIDENSVYFDEYEDDINIEIKEIRIFNARLALNNNSIFIYKTQKNDIEISDENKIYGFNRESKKNGEFICEQVLLVIHSPYAIDTEEHHNFLEKVNQFDIIKNNISLNKIIFDTYYDESIMNA